MSKSRSIGSKAAVSADVTSGRMLAHLKKVAASSKYLPKKINVIGLVVLAACALAALLFPVIGVAKIAFLYIFGFNGKVSGRTDGNVYMRNGRGRGFVVPSLVQNGNTQYVRNLLALQSQAWAGLTQSQQETWINAEGFFSSDRFGNPKAIKGKALFVALNINLVNIGQAPISAAPLHTEQPAITNLTGSTATAAGVVTLVYTPTPTDAGVTHLVYATSTLGNGINRPKKSSFRLVTIIAGAAASPQVISAAYVARFGNPILGGKIFFKTVAINNISGEAGIELVSDPVIVT